MADVYIYTDTTGVITTDTSVIQQEVQDEYKNAFGSNLNVDPDTPQGILITTETAARTAVADNNAALANQINPNLAGGIFLDALLALTGSYRIPGSPSLVLATIAGVAGTVIPAGSQASETTNNAVFATTQQVVIPAEGVLYDVEFQSLIDGPIPCSAGTLTQIVSGILGWETVTNPADATTGTAQQSDTAARNLRQVTLAAQGTSLAEAITSALYLTPGVTSLTFQENVSSTTQTINGVSMVPHSLYTCVAGTASSLAIATTLTNTKSGGCSYNNGLGIQVQQDVTNQYSGQVIEVLFDRPSIVNISMQITISALSTVQDATTAVQNAVVTYADGEVPYMSGFVVGAPVSPFQISAAIAQQISGVFVQSVQVAIISFTQQGTLTNGSNIVSGMTYTSSISVGMPVSGEGIPTDTTVSSITDDNNIVLSNNATESLETTLTFTKNPVYQTTEISMAVWQQAATQTAYITVSEA